MVQLQRYAAVLFAITGLLLAAGCTEKPEAPRFKLTDVTGASFGKDFALTDHNGQRRTPADFKGRVVTLFFGFTHCPDVCPTTLGEMAVVMKELGADAGRLQVLFVTVDPERDTAEVLKRYVPAFHPSFLGLTGSAEDVARTAKEFKIFFQKQNLPNGGYTMDHSAGTYILDGEGRLRLFAQYGIGAPALLHDIRLLLK
ncbi:MAG: SCO family protein [Burkholderiales bacterium]|jgi:protein SCO1/2|nr:SCO family protein [Burkholderiales bacterium]